MISKSDYMLFLRHPAWLWLKKNNPSKLPPVDAATQAIFDAGHAFEPCVESFEPKEFIYRGQVQLVGDPYYERQKDEASNERQVVKFPLRLSQQ